MTDEKLERLAEIGQSIWLDYIRRSFIESSELADWVDRGLRGVTSNPAIFKQAIAGSSDYDEDLRQWIGEEKSVSEIYEAMAINDIQMAADVLGPVYEETGGLDGLVSLEVSPHLAHDTEGTIGEARRLFAAVDRPNVMIKVPATEEGIPAIETLIAEGINVNVTLMFSMEQYNDVAEAYLSALEKRADANKNLSEIASVASFFISRVDVKVDDMLDRIDAPEAEALKGAIGIANGKMVYRRFQEVFSGRRWERLAGNGARVQRVLWASTSTKDPAYSDTLYPDALIGPHTVNTLPPATLRAFLDHGTVARTVDREVDEARERLDRLEGLGIDLDHVTDQLLVEGVEKFAKPFDALMESIAEKQEELIEEWRVLEARLGAYESAVDEALGDLETNGVVRRIWAHDHTVWKPSPEEIENRLGWLHIADTLHGSLEPVKTLMHDVRAGDAEGEPYTDVLLLGMGGSSLAPELFGKVFGPHEEGLDVQVLNSTAPNAVMEYADKLDPNRTLFIVASKSGTTTETLSFFKFFYRWAAAELGEGDAGKRFVAITDPGTFLVDLADEFGFRTVFLNDPNIGGRYSALSYFGLVPAALAGVDLDVLLERSLEVSRGCASCVGVKENPAAWLGAILGELAKLGRNKATFVVSSPIAPFGDWVEQLIAESTGKEGTGILPVVGEPLGDPGAYGEDRLFIHLRMEGDDTSDDQLDILADAGHPVVRLNVQDRYGLGAQFFLWEMAVAIAGERLGIHPFNQPNVESAKQRAKEMMDAYQETGQLSGGEPVASSEGIEVFGDISARSPLDALDAFLEQAMRGEYVALQAFLAPSVEKTDLLQRLRIGLRDRYQLATTLGYGPRFLHSTGQLHKGDGGNGLFIQFTEDYSEDVEIPDEAGSSESSLSFGALNLAQALGDYQALNEVDRRVIRFHLTGDPLTGLRDLIGTKGR